MTHLYDELVEICSEFYSEYFPHEVIANNLDAILKKHNCKRIAFIGGFVQVAKLLQEKGHEITFVEHTPEMMMQAQKNTFKYEI